MNNFQKLRIFSIEETAELLAEKCGQCEDMGSSCKECMKRWLERDSDNETNKA